MDSCCGVPRGGVSDVCGVLAGLLGFETCRGKAFLCLMRLNYLSAQIDCNSHLWSKKLMHLLGREGEPFVVDSQVTRLAKSPGQPARKPPHRPHQTKAHRISRTTLLATSIEIRAQHHPIIDTGPLAQWQGA